MDQGIHRFDVRGREWRHRESPGYQGLIRLASEDDPLLAILYMAFAEIRGRPASESEEDDLVHMAEIYRQNRNRDLFALVLEKEGRIGGGILAGRVYGALWSLGYTYLHPHLRGSVWYPRLVSAALEEVSVRGGQEIEFEIDATNELMKQLLERRDFGEPQKVIYRRTLWELKRSLPSSRLWPEQALASTGSSSSKRVLKGRARKPSDEVSAKPSPNGDPP